MTSSNGNIFRVTGHLCGEFTDRRWIPPTTASDAELWCLNERLSIQWWGWWFETPSGPLWHHSNEWIDECTVQQAVRLVTHSDKHPIDSLQVCRHIMRYQMFVHDDVIKWKHFPRYWPFVRGIHRSPVNSPHKGQWRGALMFSLICVWIHSWTNNREAGDLRRYCAHYDVIVM